MFNKFLLLCFITLFFVGTFCDEEKNPTSSNDGNDTLKNDSAKTYGVIRVQMDEYARTASINGVIKDGPTPQEKQWDTVASEGCLYLLTPVTPFCDPDCEWGYTCVADDSCQIEPDEIYVGTMTVTGITTKQGDAPFTIEPLVITKPKYIPDGEHGLIYPPFAEGTPVTFSIAGNENSPAFSFSSVGIPALKMLTDSVIPCEDEKPIEITWEPPSTNINSHIFINIDISYHGGTKAKIEGACDDDGSVTISWSLFNQLKGFGMSGFPKLDIYRRIEKTTDNTNAKLIIESFKRVYLAIPGIISCNNTNECPEGYTCTEDRRCEQIQ